MQDIVRNTLRDQSNGQTALTEAFEYFRNFAISELNKEELTKTKVPNIVKFLSNTLKQKEKPHEQLLKTLDQLHSSLETTIMEWLTNTDYYESFLNLSLIPTTKEKNDFVDKVVGFLKKNYHIKKEYAWKIAERLQNELKNEPARKKKNILRDLKVVNPIIQKKTIELKYNRKEKLTDDHIGALTEKILSTNDES